jgi:hypothetical protein
MMVKGALVLDRPIPIRNMASATMRGLAGRLLVQYSPDVAAKWFKPGQDGDRPPAYVFQPVLNRAMEADCCPFRIVSWDPEGLFIPAVKAALSRSHGLPFGEGSARVIGVEWGETCGLAFEGIHNPPPVQRVVLRTPLRLRRGNRWVSEDTLTLGDLVFGLTNRLNRLSLEYGSGLQLDPEPFLAQAAQAVEVERELRFVKSARRSSTQQRDIDLSGLVGHLSFRSLEAGLSSLLSAGTLIHLGKHTAEGCGAIRLEG